MNGTRFGVLSCKAIRLRLLSPFVCLLIGISMQGAATDEDGPSISVPNGVQYEVISQRTEIVADAGDCGFNDISVPNKAMYRVEVRRCREYVKGKEIRTWTDTVRTFIRCVDE